MDVQKTQEQIVPILKKYHVKKASLFGSVVTGKMNRESDIDILVEMPEKASLFDVLRVKVDLEDTLGRKVDLVEYEAIKPTLRKAILSQQVTFYQTT